MKETVYVGMSGGVDSSVAAALLQQQGYSVVGVYMKNWSQSVGGVDCPWQRDLADARAAAVQLDIPFKVFDFEAQYKQKVADVMVAEYRAGRTPNPDVLCNQDIKFRLFADTALAAGADYIATGHYARIVAGQLHTAADTNKDQTYFLHRMPREVLAKTLFPLGELTKPQVRQLAQEFNLPTATKPDSQGICFIGEVGIKDFLAEYIPLQPGPIVRASDGVEVGRHDGAAYYTLGQRHGLGIGGGQPYYVTTKDMTTNTLFVTADPADPDLEATTFTITDPHWLGDIPPGGIFQIRTRYRAAAIPGRLAQTAEGYRIELERPERAISPGQSAVIYDGQHVLGGGFIDLVESPL